MQLTESYLPHKGDTAQRSREMVSHLQRSELFRDYQKAFEETTGLPLEMRPAGTFQAALQDSKHTNPFCSLMASRNKTCAACLSLQRKLEDTATVEPQTLECFAGLQESVVPVRVGETVVAYLHTGQVMGRAPTEKRFTQASRRPEVIKSGVDLADLKTAYLSTRVVVKKQYDSIVRLLAIFAQHLSARSNQLAVQEATAEVPVIAKARAYIAEHMGEELSLVQVARAVNTSEFYFCKLFRKSTGLTFTDYVARVRVEAVKQLLLNPHKRVSEAAYEAGFQSLSQFNRVFRRIAGEAPSAYREKLHGLTTNPSLAHAA
ncbi:MAG: helix-turn-helix domain-containing protein [Opitutaceae bacterium]|nr:helix-turn-helix domain-containing protein [Opitutaceae bacterium]